MKLSRSFLMISLLCAACAPEGEREPQLQLNADWTEPEPTELEADPVLENAAPRSLLQIGRKRAPVEATWLLFWGNQAVARDEAGVQFAANTEEHEILMFDSDLEFLGHFKTDHRGVIRFGPHTLNLQGVKFRAHAARLNGT